MPSTNNVTHESIPLFFITANFQFLGSLYRIFNDNKQPMPTPNGLSMFLPKKQLTILKELLELMDHDGSYTDIGASDSPQDRLNRLRLLLDLLRVSTSIPGGLAGFYHRLFTCYREQEENKRVCEFIEFVLLPPLSKEEKNWMEDCSAPRIDRLDFSRLDGELNILMQAGDALKDEPDNRFVHALVAPPTWFTGSGINFVSRHAMGDSGSFAA